MPRKVVIERYLSGIEKWEPNSTAMCQALSNLGIVEDPGTQRFLDEFVRLCNEDMPHKYRWRLIEEKPSGRPAKRGDRVKLGSDSRTHFILGPAGFGNSIMATTGKDGLLVCLATCFTHEDGTPVTGYDPS